MIVVSCIFTRDLVSQHSTHINLGSVWLCKGSVHAPVVLHVRAVLFGLQHRYQTGTHESRFTLKSNMRPPLCSALDCGRSVMQHMAVCVVLRLNLGLIFRILPITTPHIWPSVSSSATVGWMSFYLWVVTATQSRGRSQNVRWKAFKTYCVTLSEWKGGLHTSISLTNSHPRLNSNPNELQFNFSRIAEKCASFATKKRKKKVEYLHNIFKLTLCHLFK